VHLVANFYLGQDTRTQKDRVRFHHDHSVVLRYRRGFKTGINQAAFSINNHLGFEAGGYQTDRFTDALLTDDQGNAKKEILSDHYFVGTSVAHRVWFCKNTLALSTRADMFANGGYYVIDNPGPFASRVSEYRNSHVLRMLQGAITLDVMPTDHFTFRVEYVHRRSNIPYFAGPNGTTSPSGLNDEVVPDTYVPDMQKTENRVTLSANVRL
jgi:hypothetical protein